MATPFPQVIATVRVFPNLHRGLSKLTLSNCFKRVLPLPLSNSPCSRRYHYLANNSTSIRPLSTSCRFLKGSEPGSKRSKTLTPTQLHKDDKEQGFFSELLNLRSSGQPPSFFNDDDWVTVYRFPFIRLARVVQRIKIYQTVFTCAIALPVSILSYSLGTISEQIMTLVIGGSGLACMMLMIMGTFSSRLVGIIYVAHEDPDLIRMAHMTFWGTRIDEVFKREDIVPLCDLPDKATDAWVNLKFYSEPELKLHLSIKYGSVHDIGLFYDIFGESVDLVPKKKNVVNGNDEISREEKEEKSKRSN